MASEYSVNIKLNTQQVKKDLKTIGKEIENVGRKSSGSKKRVLTTEADAQLFRDLGIKTRKFARTINPILNKADKVAAKGGMLALPDSKMLNAQVKGIKRLETSADIAAKHAERKAKAEERSAKFAVDSMKANQASAKAGAAHAKRLERMRGDTGFAAAQYGPQFDSMSLPTESALNFDRRTGKLLRGPAGSNRNTLQNLGRRFDTQSALISGGFPLLFGQGPIGAIAGGLGGGIGGMFGQMGGFAGGIAATAIVQSLSNVVDGVRKLGESLTTLDGQFNLLTEKSLFSTKEAENRAKVLQALGEREKLATLLSKELTTVLGEGGAKKLREAGEASKELDRTLAELTINLQLLLAGPITKFLKIVNDTLDPGMKVSLGEGKGNVIFGGKEEKFIEDFKGVLELFSQGQLERIFKAAADLQINPADIKARSVLQAEGLSGLSDPELQAIRKFSLGKRVNPQSEFFGGDGSDIDDAANKIIEIDTKRVAAAQKKINAMQKEVEFAQEIVDKGLEEADIQRQIDAITEGLSAEEEKILKTQGLSVRALVEKNNQAKQLIENARLIESSFESLKQNITTDLSDGIKGLIRGTQTLSETLSNVLNKLADAALNMALFGNVGGGLSPGLGLFGKIFKAEGGPVKGGGSYIVGEKGPEVFTPGVSGMVSPNSSLGGSTNVIVNVDASGSNVEGDEQQGRELGRLISVAIQSELVQQKRPGGLLA